MSEPRVVFEPEGHRYFAEQDGRRWPLAGVTSLLVEAGKIDTTFFKPWYAQRGTMVHLATELDDRGKLDEESVDERIKGYLAAWRDFKAVLRLRFIKTEYIAYDIGLGFAGTADRLVEIPGDGHLRVLDIKSGSAAPSHRLQVAAYVRGERDHPWPELDAMLVYLRPNGKWTTTPVQGMDLLSAVREFEGICIEHKHSLDPTLNIW